MGMIMSREHAGGETALARPLKELERMWPHEVLAMQVEQQAELADRVCRAGAADAAVCTTFLRDLRAEFPLGPPSDTTGVGNLAYLSLHAVDPEQRAEFATAHRAYILMLLRRLARPE
jgi:hypothetical protein